MIRFSASLVAIAIGLLVAGVVTSKLALVYIAIGVSGVALLALGVGVVLNWRELAGQSGTAAPGVSAPEPAPDVQAPAVQAAPWETVPAAAGATVRAARAVPAVAPWESGSGSSPPVTACLRPPAPGAREWRADPFPARTSRQPPRPAQGAEAPASAATTAVPAPVQPADASVPSRDGEPAESPPAAEGEPSATTPASEASATTPASEASATAPVAGTSAAQPAEAIVAQPAEAFGALASPQSEGLEIPEEPEKPDGPGEPTGFSEPMGPSEPEQPGGPEASAQSGPDPTLEVTVVPGVPRYHNAHCILIRFMGESDLDKMTLAAAREAGCTPCRACLPDQPGKSPE